MFRREGHQSGGIDFRQHLLQLADDFAAPHRDFGDSPQVLRKKSVEIRPGRDALVRVSGRAGARPSHLIRSAFCILHSAFCIILKHSHNRHQKVEVRRVGRIQAVAETELVAAAHGHRAAVLIAGVLPALQRLRRRFLAEEGDGTPATRHVQQHAPRPVRGVVRDLDDELRRSEVEFVGDFENDARHLAELT